MKKYVFGLAIALVSTTAFAEQTISLSAGSVARLNVAQPTTVYCQGQSSNGETVARCKIESSGGIFNVVSDGKIIQGNIFGMEEAIGVVKKLRSAGLCD